MSSETPAKGPARTSRLRWVALVFLFLVLGSVPLRLTQLGKPLLGRHNFRQTQTAITVWSFEEAGIRPFGYQTPVLGPPWRVPMEFPTFQMAAACLAVTGIEIDTACRLTNILFFYLSALLLYFLCRSLVPHTLVAEMAVAAFCWMPYNIYWSAQCMIDFAAVAFALAYTLALQKWVENPGRPLFFGAAFVTGVLAYLTKVTTMAAFLPLICGLVLVAVVPGVRSAGHLVTFLRTRWKFVAGLVFLIAAPILIEHSWVTYSDHVKTASPFTAWLTSENLMVWNFGTVGQRLSLVNWSTIGDHLNSGLPPFVVLTLIGLGFVALRFHESRGRVLFLAAAAGMFGAIGVFFNLFLVHDYYLIAVTAPLAVMVGFAGELLLIRPLQGKPFGVLILIAIAGHIASLDLFPPPKDFTLHEYRLALRLREITAPDEWLVVADRDWNPFLLYHARRRGFMLRGKGFGPAPISNDEITRYLQDNGFSIVVTATERHWLTSKWRRREALPSLAGYFIYRVTDSDVDSRSADP